MTRPAEENTEQSTVPVQTEQQQEKSFLYAATSQTPWWGVSILLHGLVITLAGLVTMVIEMPEKDPSVVTVPPWITPRDDTPKSDEPSAKPEHDQILASLLPVNATTTCPDGPDPKFDIAISDEMRRLASFGDHIETINLNLEDAHTAHGSDESTFLHTVTYVDKEGGDNRSVAADLEDVIGVGPRFNAIKGKGASEDGEGPGDGPHTGTIGNRFKGGNKNLMLRISGGDVHETVLTAALHWLAYHQEADGRWDAKKYGANFKTDTAVTGLALLTFLGAGNTEKVGVYKMNVKNAVAWLKSKQDASGLIWDTTDDGARHRAKGYPGAIATLALVEAAGMANDPDTRKCAQKAIDYCTDVHQNGEGSEKLGWRYGSNEAADMSVSGWFIMALKSAKIAGLNVNHQSMEGAIKFLETVEHKVDGAGSSYAPVSQFWYMVGEEHANSAHRLTAIGTLARQFLGWQRADLQPSVEWFVNKGGVPDYGVNGESVDLYYWYYGSMCVFQQGPQSELWKRWNTAMKKAIGEHQSKNGDDAGSWDPAGEFSGEWGRVGQTALNALCMEVYYRYALMNQ